MHSIHAKNINKACHICHGSWAAVRTYNPESAFLQSAKVQENMHFKQFTMFDIIKNIFNILSKISEL